MISGLSHPPYKFILPTEAYRGEGLSYYFAEPQDYIKIKNTDKLAEFFKERNLPYVQGEKEFITAPFAYKILKKLQKAGIVKGFRGVHGGYSLNRVAKELTLYDVYTAIDPEFFIIDCLEPGYQCTCDGSGNQICTVHRELQRVQKELCKMLQEKNLEDIFHLKNRNRL